MTIAIHKAIEAHEHTHIEFTKRRVEVLQDGTKALEVMGLAMLVESLTRMLAPNSWIH